jgi:hypothetical protein
MVNWAEPQPFYRWSTKPCRQQDVALVSGGFRRSIPVKEFEHLADTGEAIGLLGDLLEFSKQDPEEISKLLNQELSIPLILTSRLINTRIGEAIIRRVARIIYPIYTPQAEVSVPAIRAGIINGLHQTDGLTAVGFLKGLSKSSDGRQSSCAVCSD